jgi:hypothetical protein
MDQTIQISASGPVLGGTRKDLQPIIGAVVEKLTPGDLQGINVGATNGSGNAFVLASPGDRLRVRFPGYQDLTMDVNQGTTALAFILKPGESSSSEGVTLTRKVQPWYQRPGVWIAMIILLVLLYLIWKNHL